MRFRRLAAGLFPLCPRVLALCCSHPCDCVRALRAAPAEQVIQHKFQDWNSDKKIWKGLQRARLNATIHGDLRRIAEFDQAAAAFPNPTPLVTATCVLSCAYVCCAAVDYTVAVAVHSLLERANVVMRDPSPWETEFWEFQEWRNDAYDKVRRCVALSCLFARAPRLLCASGFAEVPSGVR